mgnify:CR=1 FL=1
MTPENFAYWLQGFAELTPEQPSAAQWQAIRDHLALVFEKKTPDRTPSITYPPGVRTFEQRLGDFATQATC